MDNEYKVRPLTHKEPIVVSVPGSKSITNRALMLAALSQEKCLLRGVLFSDDSRAFLDCLQKLGFELDISQERREVLIQGTGGRIPNEKATVNVRSAGTAARFLTVFLALAGGEYRMDSSEQMAKRPMEPLLNILKQGGADITYRGQEGHFPFTLCAKDLRFGEIEIDTSLSSQFASALLMAGTLLEDGLTLRLTGSRTAGSYIKMTLSMMEQFGIRFEALPEGNGYHIPGGQKFVCKEYLIEPDLSAAAYFYSMAPLLKTKVLVRDVHRPSLQGDMKYVELLEKLGCTIEEKEEGLWLSGKELSSYPGIRVDMKDFSDQTMTLSAVAVYADSVTEIVNVGHIRAQESDRMAAILAELTRMGIRAEEIPEEEGIRIYPGTPKPSGVETYEDHRMAMAFSLIGLRTKGITIKNPGCCKKTFENYFDVLDDLYKD